MERARNRDLPTLGEEAERWIERRKQTHRAWADDRSRWRNHLAGHFGHLRAPDVDEGRIRAFVEDKLREGLDPATAGHCVRLLSTFYSDLCERPRETGATRNPVRALPRSTRRLYRPKHDPKKTPFDNRRISVHEQVRVSKLGPVKDDEARFVPILDDLAPVLAEYKLKSGGTGRLFQPEQPGRRAGKNGAPSQFMRPNTLHEALAAAIAKVKPAGNPATWYHCTRHTFASQWVMAGGSLEKLAHVLGHSSTEVTKRYAHLRPDAFGDADRARIRVQLGQRMASTTDIAAARKRRIVKR